MRYLFSRSKYCMKNEAGLMRGFVEFTNCFCWAESSSATSNVFKTLSPLTVALSAFRSSKANSSVGWFSWSEDRNFKLFVSLLEAELLSNSSLSTKKWNEREKRFHSMQMKKIYQQGILTTNLVNKSFNAIEISVFVIFFICSMNKFI